MADIDPLVTILAEAAEALRRFPGAVEQVRSGQWRVTFRCDKGHALITVYGLYYGPKGNTHPRASIDLFPIAEHEADRVRAFWGSRRGWQEGICVEALCGRWVPGGAFLCDEHRSSFFNSLENPVTGMLCRRCGRAGHYPRVLQFKHQMLIESYLQAVDNGVHYAALTG